MDASLLQIINIGIKKQVKNVIVIQERPIFYIA